MSQLPDDLQTQRVLDNWLPEIPVEPLSARYQVLGDPIGRGGFGVVYRARKLQLPQHVAVKRLRTADGKAPALSEQQRFVREVTLAASLKHPNIVSIEAWGRDQDGLYVVMDLVEGGCLKSLVDQSGPVAVSTLLRYARQICLGLQVAHRRGILHRDLKPANMLLDRFGNVQLADFGLARSASGDLDALVKSSGLPMYTYAYASPEQMEGDSLDVRSDLFSLGATLYHLLAGKPAYDRDFDLEAIPGELQGLLSGLLKKKRDQRPATVDVVLEQLTELQKHCVSGTTPPQPPGSQVNRGTSPQAASAKPGEVDLASHVEKVPALDLLIPSGNTQWSEPVMLIATDTTNLNRNMRKRNRSEVINKWLELEKFPSQRLIVKFLDQPSQPEISFVSHRSSQEQKTVTAEKGENGELWRAMVKDACKENPLKFAIVFRYELTNSPHSQNSIN